METNFRLHRISGRSTRQESTVFLVIAASSGVECYRLSGKYDRSFGGVTSSGRYGIIYSFRHVQAGGVENLRREIRALARIHHPGIVPILEEGIEDGYPWYAMEYIEGISLRQFLAQAENGGKEVNKGSAPDPDICRHSQKPAPPSGREYRVALHPSRRRTHGKPGPPLGAGR